MLSGATKHPDLKFALKDTAMGSVQVSFRLGLSLLHSQNLNRFLLQVIKNFETCPACSTNFTPLADSPSTTTMSLLKVRVWRTTLAVDDYVLEVDLSLVPQLSTEKEVKYFFLHTNLTSKFEGETFYRCKRKLLRCYMAYQECRVLEFTKFHVQN